MRVKKRSFFLSHFPKWNYPPQRRKSYSCYNILLMHLIINSYRSYGQISIIIIRDCLRRVAIILYELKLNTLLLEVGIRVCIFIYMKKEKIKDRYTFKEWDILMKTILFATDGSKSSEHAGEMIKEYLEAFPQAELIILYVTSKEDYAYDLIPDVVD